MNTCTIYMNRSVLIAFSLLAFCCTLHARETVSAAADESAGVSAGDIAKKSAQAALERLDKELEDLGTTRTEILKNAAHHPLKTTALVPEHAVFPEHKRRRLLLLPPEVEKRIADQCIESVKADGSFYEDAADYARVSNIVARLAPVLTNPVDIRIYLLKDDSVNACCLPDGTVFVNRGTLAAVKDEDMLAAILAHEYGHAVAQHGNERLSRYIKWAAGDGVADATCEAIAKESNKVAGSAAQLAYGIGKNTGIMLPRSRRAEFEADRLGLLFMTRAGFDPKGMVRLFQFFQSLQTEKEPAWLALLSTHPTDEKRIENVRAATELVQ